MLALCVCPSVCLSAVCMCGCVVCVQAGFPMPMYAVWCVPTCKCRVWGSMSLCVIFLPRRTGRQILFLKKERNNAICGNMGGPGDDYTQ